MFPYCIGIDPGPEMGISVFHDLTQLYVGQGAADDILHFLCEILRNISPDAVVHIGIGQYPTDAVGSHIAQACSRRSGAHLHGQAPTDAGRVMPTSRLRELGLWCSGDNLGLPDADGANMATSHALLCMLDHCPHTFCALTTGELIGRT
jgi:hypothetical protein